MRIAVDAGAANPIAFSIVGSPLPRPAIARGAAGIETRIEREETMRNYTAFAFVGIVGVLVPTSPPVIGLGTAGVHDGARHHVIEVQSPEGHDGFLGRVMSGSVPVAIGCLLNGASCQKEVAGRIPAEIE
ncbi:hypothetical protein [Sorangium sp. So ce131]|uniref:hypothetical protein n=1 Tax=Sorangium sp. So ce131 TaxID=3133282 RepID=UPI003F5DAACE